MKSEEIIEWSIEEYSFRKKSVDWFWALGIGAIAAATASIMIGNILFAAIIIIGAIAIALIALKTPKQISIKIGGKGIFIENKFYPYENIESFSIDQNVYPAKLILISEKVLMPHIVVPIPEEIDLDELEEKISLKIKKGDHREPLIDILANRLGF